MKKCIKLLVLFVGLIINYPTYAQDMSAEMLALCKRAKTEPFTPSPLSLKSPNPDPLYNAIEMGANGDKVKSLLAGRHPDEIISPVGLTPLAFAASVGNWEATKTLLSIGADVNLYKEGMQLTALNSSVLYSKYTFACKLIQNNARFPISKEEKGSFLSRSSLATFSPQEDAAVFVDYLLSKGFDVNDGNSTLATPLMGAVSLNNIPVIKVLLKHGARLDIVKRNGLTVWDVARRKNNPEVLKILREAARQQGVQEPVGR